MSRLSMSERLKKSGGPTIARLDEARKNLQKQTKEQSKGQSVKQSNGQSGGHSNGVAVSLADTLTDSRTVTHKNTPKVVLKNIPKRMPKNTLPDGPGENPFFWMTPNQAAVLLFLTTIPDSKTRLADICNCTGVPYGTVRKALVALERNNCITKPKKIRIGQWQGMHTELLESGRYWNTLNNTLADSQPDSLVNGLSGGHSGGQSLISSSSYSNKTTTKDLDYIYKTNPEIGYWRQKGLTVKQINMWSKQFDLKNEEIIQNLCYCRFDMVDNDRENSETIKDVFNWFYRIVERTGTYPKPVNYKSHQEKLIEKEKERIAETKRQTAELKKVRQESIFAQQDLDFEKMMQNPESDEYKNCFEKIPSILKNPRKAGSISFINAIKKAYCELNDIELF